MLRFERFEHLRQQIDDHARRRSKAYAAYAALRLTSHGVHCIVRIAQPFPAAEDGLPSAAATSTRTGVTRLSSHRRGAPSGALGAVEVLGASLRRKWGASLAVSHVVGIERRFLGTGIRQYDNPDTMTAEMVDWKYKRRELITDAIPPGTRLREVELAARMHVSRTPVR